MPELAFVTAPDQSRPLRELVETVRHELGEQGVPSLVHTEGFPEPTPERVYVLVAPNEFVGSEGEDALPTGPLLKRTIYLCSQRPGSAEFDQEVALSRDAGAVFTVNARAVSEFTRTGIHARFLRPGYSPIRDRVDPGAQRDVDVVFLGGLTPRRAKYLAACAPVLASYNCELRLSESSRPDVLPRTKIVLGIHRSNETDFDWLCGLDAIHAGAVIVTEHSSGMGPLVAGEHLFAAKAESLPIVLDAALRDPEALERMRSATRDRVRSWMPQALSVAILRAAAVELVGRPVPADASLRRGLRSRAERSNRSASATGDTVGTDPVALGRPVRDVRQLDLTSPITAIVHQSPAWNLRRNPRVTVITALYNQATLVGAALDSLARSHLRELELIVVDDGSGDDSRRGTTDWMMAHPWIPARLIHHGTRCGVGAARNTAVDVARAPYAFVFDADTAVYPRCLNALVATLDSHRDATFAYPMLELFGISEAVEDSGYLENVLGWQSERLRLGNYIEEPSMIRLNLLRELGGFRTDPHLDGWELYDLWCRIAERGGSGQQVRQILARRHATVSKRASAAVPASPA